MQGSKPKETEESYQARYNKDIQDCIKFCEENSIQLKFCVKCKCSLSKVDNSK